jgi:hypothetical protein
VGPLLLSFHPHVCGWGLLEDRVMLWGYRIEQRVDLEGHLSTIQNFIIAVMFFISLPDEYK